MWHASVSLQVKGTFLADEARLERLAVSALRGVGGGIEWWIMKQNDATGVGTVGHLRVPVTAAEAVRIPPGLVTTDAGQTGPMRPRT